MMLRERLVTAGLLVPIFLWVIYQGGWIYNVVVFVLLTVAIWEFCEIGAKASLRPSRAISLLSMWALAAVSGLTSGNWLLACIVVSIMITTIWHIVDYEKGATHSLQNWALSLIGPAYIGLLGGHLLSLRALPSGQWLTLTVLPVVWISDTGAYKCTLCGPGMYSELMGSTECKYCQTGRIASKKSSVFLYCP